MEVLGLIIHFEQGHRKWKIHIESLLKLFMKCCQRYLYSLCLIVGKGRFKSMYGRAFHSLGSLQK